MLLLLNYDGFTSFNNLSNSMYVCKHMALKEIARNLTNQMFLYHLLFIIYLVLNSNIICEAYNIYYANMIRG